jgi:outer membrane protein assembly factor BamB
MRWRLPVPFVIAVAVATPAVLAASAGATAWTTYRHDAARSGMDPDSTSPVTPSQAWQTAQLDGEVYGQPLVYGSRVYVATENDTVDELDATSGAVLWSTHLATPESSTVAPCGDIKPLIGITSTPVIDTAASRIYAVGAVSAADGVHHELFALDLSSGQPIAGFPIVVDPPYPSGGAAVNQLQRVGLALDGGRILIGYGGNSGDCATYWGWLVSAPADGQGGLSFFQVDADFGKGAIWASGNAPAVDAGGNVFVATGNGSNNSSSDPEYSESVVKLDAFASPLDWWAPPNWQSLDASDADLGSSMPTLLPGGHVFQSGKDRNGYLLNGADLGHIGSAPVEAAGFCPSGSRGGSVYDPTDSTIYISCLSGLKAMSFGLGSPPSLAPKPGFLAPAGATGLPLIAGGLVWVTNYASGTLYGLDPTSGATVSQFPIPEVGGNAVNHFASPSAGGGRLFVGSGDQVTAFTIAQPPPGSTTGQPPPGSTTGQPPPGSTGTTAASGAGSGGPAISRVSISPRRFRPKRAVTLRLTLSEPATVTVGVTQLHHGRLVHRRCSPRAKRGKKCQVRVTFVRLHLKGHVGPNAFKLRLRRRAPGHYTAFIYATDNSGRRSGTILIRFTILPAQSSSTRRSSLRPAGASLMSLATSLGLGTSHPPS